jgi:hypothetical protein
MYRRALCAWKQKFGVIIVSKETNLENMIRDMLRKTSQFQEAKEKIETYTTEREYYNALHTLRKRFERLEAEESTAENECRLLYLRELIWLLIEQASTRFDLDASDLLKTEMPPIPGTPPKKKFTAWYEEVAEAAWNKMSGWCEEMAVAALKERFEKTLCSGCDFAKAQGWQYGVVPCTLFPGLANALIEPWLCALWTPLPLCSREKFLEKMGQEKGRGAKRKFLEKERELKQKPARIMVEQGKELLSHGGVMNMCCLQQNLLFLKKNGFQEELEDLLACAREHQPQYVSLFEMILSETAE